MDSCESTDVPDHLDSGQVDQQGAAKQARKAKQPFLKRGEGVSKRLSAWKHRSQQKPVSKAGNIDLHNVGSHAELDQDVQHADILDSAFQAPSIDDMDACMQHGSMHGATAKRPAGVKDTSGVQ